MNFEFRYVITYESGQIYDSKNSTLCVPVTKEEYKSIVRGVLNGIPMIENTEIPQLLEKMKELVEFCDRYKNLNGSDRKTPLKKARHFSKLEYYMSDYDYNRIRKMKDPLAEIDRPAQQMTIYRADGSSVTITSENGLVQIRDSRNKNSYHQLDADYFISKIL